MYRHNALLLRELLWICFIQLNRYATAHLMTIYSNVWTYCWLPVSYAVIWCFLICKFVGTSGLFWGVSFDVCLIAPCYFFRHIEIVLKNKDHRSMRDTSKQSSKECSKQECFDREVGLWALHIYFFIIVHANPNMAIGNDLTFPNY